MRGLREDCYEEEKEAGEEEEEVQAWRHSDQRRMWWMYREGV